MYGLLASSLAFIVSCASPVGDQSDLTGLSITIGNEVNARTLVPAINMETALYAVIGTGPTSAAEFTATTTGGTVTKTGLALGNWTIVVNATNAAGIIIGTGSGTALVSNGATTAVSISVTPVVGTGNLALTITWPDGQVSSPSISATLTPALGSSQAIPFAISGTSASYANPALANGYYTFAFTLYDSGITVAGGVDIVRIVAGQATDGTFAFSNVNTPGGTIQVTVTDNLLNPLAVSIAGASAIMSLGSTQVLTASVSNYSDSKTFSWYVNGAIVGTGASYNFSGRKLGYYRLDAIAVSSDGKLTGSATTSIQVNPAAGPAVVMLGTAENFAVLAQSGITIGAAPAVITGDIGLNAPAAGFVGFGQVLDGSGAFSTSVPASLLAGKAYAASYSGTTPAALTSAIADFNTAYADAAGRLNPDFIDLGSGELGGRTLLPGLYKWGGAASITTDVTLQGGPYDIWIFQVNGALAMAAAISIHLTGGADPGNIFWQATGAVSIGANANFAGIVLSHGAIGAGAGSTVIGRFYSTTTVTVGAGASLMQTN